MVGWDGCLGDRFGSAKPHRADAIPVNTTLTITSFGLYSPVEYSLWCKGSGGNARTLSTVANQGMGGPRDVSIQSLDLPGTGSRCDRGRQGCARQQDRVVEVL